MTREFADLDDFRRAAGQTLGTSKWLPVNQARIDLFAEATGDHQWIHVNAERAARGPFGSTIAHGYLTLSLLPAFISSIFIITDKQMGVNYGLNRVRFPTPVPAGSRVRATAILKDVEDIGAGLQATLSFVVECEDSSKPACIAEAVFIYR